MLRRTSSRSVTESWPATNAAPDVGRASVHSTLIVVVLPAPFGPRKPNTSPGATSKLTPRTASTSPKDFFKSRTSIAGIVMWLRKLQPLEVSSKYKLCAHGDRPARAQEAADPRGDRGGGHAPVRRAGVRCRD